MVRQFWRLISEIAEAGFTPGDSAIAHGLIRQRQSGQSQRRDAPLRIDAQCDALSWTRDTQSAGVESGGVISQLGSVVEQYGAAPGRGVEDANCPLHTISVMPGPRSAQGAIAQPSRTVQELERGCSVRAHAEIDRVFQVLHGVHVAPQ